MLYRYYMIVPLQIPVSNAFNAEKFFTVSSINLNPVKWAYRYFTFSSYRLY